METREEECKLCRVLGFFWSLKPFDFISFCFSPGVGWEVPRGRLYLWKDTFKAQPRLSEVSGAALRVRLTFLLLQTRPSEGLLLMHGRQARKGTSAFVLLEQWRGGEGGQDPRCYFLRAMRAAGLCSRR